MYEISVRTEDGKVIIEGREPGADLSEYGRVAVPSEQVEALISWLQEARDELVQAST